MTEKSLTMSADLSLQEMLRVMDVARMLRTERETVAREFSRDETRAALRQRMLEATAVTGEELTEAEIDAALDAYYDKLHVFRPPRPGLATTFAHMWVLRRAIGVALLLIAGAGLVVTWTEVPGSPSRVTTPPADVTPQATSAAPRPTPDTSPPVVASVDDVADEEYEVRIVTGEGRKSGFDRYYTDHDGKRAPAYYVIVEAVTLDGRVLPQRIRNAETGQYETVTSWGERVPDAVYERIKADKQVDGVLDESLFAVKRAGESEIEIVLPGTNGAAIPRRGQITKW